MRKSNVFVDLGFSQEEAAGLLLKSRLLTQIVRQAAHYSQAQLQELLHEPQPRISDLLRGKSAKFSLETLVNYADALKMRPEIKLHTPAGHVHATA